MEKQEEFEKTYKIIIFYLSNIPWEKLDNTFEQEILFYVNHRLNKFPQRRILNIYYKMVAIIIFAIALITIFYLRTYYDQNKPYKCFYEYYYNIFNKKERSFLNNIYMIKNKKEINVKSDFFKIEREAPYNVIDSIYINVIYLLNKENKIN